MPSSQASRGEADNEETAINPIDNAPALDVPANADLPNDYEFEIYRLRQRVASLESAVRDKDDRIRHCLTMIEDELLFWRTGMLDHVWETMGGIQGRIVRLESTLAFIKDIQAHVWPRLETPAWKKKAP